MGLATKSGGGTIGASIRSDTPRSFGGPQDLAKRHGPVKIRQHEQKPGGGIRVDASMKQHYRLRVPENSEESINTVPACGSV
jgi:hypothetical protein